MKADFQALFDKAHAAGHAAAMVLPSDGLCGFGWVHFAGTTAWGRWAKKNGRAKPAHPGDRRLGALGQRNKALLG